MRLEGIYGGLYDPIHLFFYDTGILRSQANDTSVCKGKEQQAVCGG
jgi:hypothetical protein